MGAIGQPPCTVLEEWRPTVIMQVKNPRALLGGLAALAGVYGASVYNLKKKQHLTPSPTTVHSTTPTSTSSTPPIYDALIIGGGVVGLSVAHTLSSRGATVLLLERDVSLASGASSGNSGLGCTGYDAPIGSLERRLLRRSIRLHQHLYRSFGMSHDHIRKCGSLVVAWTPAELASLPHVLEENVLAGDDDATLLSQEELRRLEPAISEQALGAVFCPREAVVEPWLVPVCYAAAALINGATIRTSSLVVGARFDDKKAEWEVDVAESREKAVGRSEAGEVLTKYVPAPAPNHDKVTTFKARTVINCAGLYGDEVEELSTSQKAFKITPRKGQFVVFQPKPGTAIPETIVEPVATQFTKGVIAWKTVWGTVVVGPTAVDQESKDDRSTDAETIETLRKAGERIIPALKDAKVLGTYSGLRPASEHRDYQIYASEGRRWITVAGIRSTGLTASSGIGDYVGDLWEDLVGRRKLEGSDGDNKVVVAIEKAGDKIAPDELMGVTEAAVSPLPIKRSAKRLNKLPTLQEMALEYRLRGDGMITIHGRDHRVTHPLSSFGMGAMGADEVEEDHAK
jgi:glycerol-3-phosphate dehydrogenase